MSNTYPLFALDELVPFPGVAIPLHFFEPRYVQMIDDVMKHDQPRFAVSRLHARDKLDYYLNPSFEPVGCIMDVLHYELGDDDTRDVLVMGTERVTLAEGEGRDDVMYRVVHATPHPTDAPPDELLPWFFEQQDVIESRLKDKADMGDMFERLREGDLLPVHLLNIFCNALLDNPDDLQTLLEESTCDTAWELVRQWLSASEGNASNTD